jgi:hypothetical protein
MIEVTNPKFVLLIGASIFVSELSLKVVAAAAANGGVTTTGTTSTSSTICPSSSGAGIDIICTSTY